jgi:diketogulonate reductase-like aldo/keto reductase
MQQKTVSINSYEVPRFIYGTAWKENATQKCVTDALNTGFRAIDTANQRKHYYEEGVGAALLKFYESGVLKREDLFIQTKFTQKDGQDHRLPYDPSADMHAQVMQSFASSLKHLHTDYIDSYVLHGPSTHPGLARQDIEVWNAMQDLHSHGKVRLLGVSNVVLNQLELICKKGTKPAFVQNRCYAEKHWDKDVRDFCKQNNIHYQGFSLLTANTWIVKDPRFQEIVSHYACPATRIIFCFALQVEMLPLTGTTNSEHMKEDLRAFDFKLSAEEIEIIETLGG